MIFCVEDEVSYPAEFDPEALGRSAAEETLKILMCPFEAEVNLLLTDDEGIRELNLKHRNNDSPTDVLSFPAFKFAEPADFESCGYDKPGIREPGTGTVWLGDIVLNMNRMAAQADEFGHGTRREFAFLVTHSMLHLCGYDHENKEDEEIMIQKQEEILGAIHLPRE